EQQITARRGLAISTCLPVPVTNRGRSHPASEGEAHGGDWTNRHGQGCRVSLRGRGSHMRSKHRAVSGGLTFRLTLILLIVAALGMTVMGLYITRVLETYST